MNRKVFVQLHTLIYVTFVAVLSINLMACDPETPETGGSNNGQVDEELEGGVPDDSQGDNSGEGNESTPKETITIGEYGCEAYCSASALDFSKLEELKAYVATGYDDGAVTLTRVRTVKSGEGILVKGTPGGDYEVPILEHSNDNTLNLLVGVLENTTVPAKSSDDLYCNYYWNPANTCFEPISESMVLANSVYIQVPEEWESWTGAELRFDDGDFATTENGK